MSPTKPVRGTKRLDCYDGRAVRGRPRFSRRGFTLVELAVIALLLLGAASIVLPSFWGAKDKARNASVAANVNTLRLGLEVYAAANGGSYPDQGGPHGLVKALAATKRCLPGDQMPRPGWSGERQTEAIPAVQVATVDPAGHLAGAGQQPSRLGTVLGPSKTPDLRRSTDGARYAYPLGGSPEDALIPGAIAYDRRGKRYVLYGTGKRGIDLPLIGGAEAIVVAVATDPLTEAELGGRQSPAVRPRASAVPKPPRR